MNCFVKQKSSEALKNFLDLDVDYGFHFELVSITYKMELENILSPKNQTFAYVIKEFANDRLYLEKTPKTALTFNTIREGKYL